MPSPPEGHRPAPSPPAEGHWAGALPPWRQRDIGRPVDHPSPCAGGVEGTVSPSWEEFTRSGARPRVSGPRPAPMPRAGPATVATARLAQLRSTIAAPVGGRRWQNALVRDRHRSTIGRHYQSGGRRTDRRDSAQRGGKQHETFGRDLRSRGGRGRRRHRLQSLREPAAPGAGEGPDEPPDRAERLRDHRGVRRSRPDADQQARARRRGRRVHARLPVARAGDQGQPPDRARLQRQRADPLGRPGAGRRARVRSDQPDRRRPGQAVRLQLRLPGVLPAAPRLRQLRARPAARQSRVHQPRADVPGLGQGRRRRGQARGRAHGGDQRGEPRGADARAVADRDDGAQRRADRGAQG